VFETDDNPMYAQQYAIHFPYVKQLLSLSTLERERKSFPRGNHCPLQRRSRTGSTVQTASFQTVTRGSQDVNMTTHLPPQTETKNAESHTPPTYLPSRHGAQLNTVTIVSFDLREDLLPFATELSLSHLLAVEQALQYKRL